MKPMLFISHATHDKALAEAVRDHFEADFDTFLDSDDVKAGENWRQKIELALLECHAALILLSEHSIDRDWVRDEAWMLSMLARNLPGRIVIPLLVDDLEVARLKDKGLEPAGLDANQARAIDSADPDLTAVKARLQPLAEEFAQRTDLVHVERYVASKLAALDINGQEAVAEALDLDVSHLKLARNPTRLLASKLLTLRDLDAFEDFILAVAGHAGTDGRGLALDLLSDVFPYCWVDNEIARQLAELLLRRDAPRPMVGLVAGKPETAKCYVTCAAARAPLESWRVLDCTSAFSHEDSVEHLVEEIMAQARELRRCPVPDADDGPGSKLIRCWERYTRKRGPRVVLFPAAFSEMDGDLLDELNRRFQQLNFLVACSDHDPGLEQRFANFVLLPTPDHEEDEAGAVYDQARYDLNPETRQ